MIEARDLRKDYIIPIREKGLTGMAKSLINPEKKVITAVKDLNLSIEEGELVGYIGPNGAGKSTLFILIPRRWEVDM